MRVDEAGNRAEAGAVHHAHGEAARDREIAADREDAVPPEQEVRPSEGGRRPRVDTAQQGEGFHGDGLTHAALATRGSPPRATGYPGG